MAIAFLNAVGSAHTVTTNPTLTFSGMTTTGNSQMTCFVFMNALAVSTITDSAGNLWQQVAAFTGSPNIEIWATKSNKAAQITTLTVTISGNARFVASFAEYSGVGAFNVTSQVSGTSQANPFTTGNMTYGGGSWMITGFGNTTNAAPSSGAAGANRSGSGTTGISGGGFDTNGAASPSAVTAGNVGTLTYAMFSIEMVPTGTDFNKLTGQWQLS